MDNTFREIWYPKFIPVDGIPTLKDRYIRMRQSQYVQVGQYILSVNNEDSMKTAKSMFLRAIDALYYDIKDIEDAVTDKMDMEKFGFLLYLKREYLSIELYFKAYQILTFEDVSNCSNKQLTIQPFN